MHGSSLAEPAGKQFAVRSALDDFDLIYGCRQKLEVQVGKSEVGRKPTMKPAPVHAVITMLFIAAVSFAQDRNQPTPRSQERITREVRHALLMLPYFGVFDNLAFKVEGNSVTLLGQVVRPTLKSDAESSVKRIEGVEQVINQIEVLPPSPMDDRLRRALFRAIYGYPALRKYALGVQKPIRILVKNGHVDLEGVVDSDSDKNLAAMRANGVPGIFSVDNNLQVAESK
jgi:hyperosmotically inducible periplasmic protein